MATNVLCVAARSIIRDGDINSVSIIEVFEQIQATGFPFFIQGLAVLAIWKRGETDTAVSRFVYRFRVTNNAHVLHESEVDGTFGTGQLHRSLLRMQGLVVLEPGNLRFEFLDGEVPVGVWTIEVSVPQSPLVVSQT